MICIVAVVGVACVAAGPRVVETRNRRGGVSATQAIVGVVWYSLV